MNASRFFTLVIACVLGCAISQSSRADYVISLQSVAAAPGTMGTVDVLLAFDPASPTPNFNGYDVLVDFTNTPEISFGTPIHNGGAFDAPSDPPVVSDDFTVEADPFGGIATFGVSHSDATMIALGSPVKLFSVPFTVAAGTTVGTTNGLTLQLFDATGVADGVGIGFRSEARDLADGTSYFFSTDSAVATAVPEPSPWMFLSLVGVIASGRSYFIKRLKA